MEYKGYYAKVEFDDDADIFHGEVVNLRDLEFCAKRGENPEKPYSGRFVVRVEPELHKNVTVEARRAGVSLNAWVADTISKALHGHARQERSC